MDHILPVSLYPEYVSAPENRRSACRPCNSARGDRYTEAEKQQVLATIAARQARTLSYSRNGVSNVTDSRNAT